MKSTQDLWVELHKESRHQPRYPSEHVVQFVFRNFPVGGGKILDLGCGAGRHLKFLAENGYDAYGCDYSSTGIDAAKKLLHANNLFAEYCVCNTNNLPYKDEYFHGVICLGALFYNTKEDIEKSALEIWRILCQKGKAYISLRGFNDYRYATAIKNTKYDVVLNESNPDNPAFKENGMRMYFFDKQEVYRIFHMFSDIEINTSLVTSLNGLLCDEYLFVTLIK